MRERDRRRGPPTPTENTLVFGDEPDPDGGPPPVREDGYDDLGAIGEGGMGEVRRVRDRELNRVLAMKVIRGDLLSNRAIVARFVEEAQATAQLEHPGIVPVHELGTLPDGRHYFTMKEVRGRTLTEVIDAVHDASTAGRWGTSPEGDSFHRLLDAFRRVCEAVAHAHARGVIHRDLKPDNVMVGAYGEVLVLDWGLAKVRGQADRAAEAGDLDVIRTDRSADDALRTRVGTVAGTPAYMPPEQARGQIDRLDARSDVYALGAILYQALSGRPPYEGDTAMDVVRQVLSAPPDTPGRPGGPPIAEELYLLCGRAMARDPEERFADAGVLAAEVGAWIEGAHKRERALSLVREAEELLPDVAVARAQAAEHRQDAARLLDGLRPWEPVERKKLAWTLEDEADRLDAEAETRELQVTQLLQGALTHASDLPEAHALLADLYRQRHAEAEAKRDRAGMRRYEALLRAHDDGRYAGYLAGEGRLTLVTDPPAEVELLRYVERDRRLVAEPFRSLGRTPIRDVVLPSGSYLAVLRAEGRDEVRYPVQIGREERWDGVPPGEIEPLPVRLPLEGELGPDDVYVPAGWFWSGGDAEAQTSLPRRRVWVDAFAIRRHPVTNREYLAFLNGLLDEGREADALAHGPRLRSAGDRPGTPIYGQDADGRFVLLPDADGDAWDPDYPVLLVDWWSACAFAEWTARTTGLPWRLPDELEWEKAARGVDGRSFPWGDHFDATWACLRDSHPGRPLPVVVSAFPTDVGPYGMRGAAGNAIDWCADVFRADGPFVTDGRYERAPARDVASDFRVNRGGGWSATTTAARLCQRRGAAPDFRSESIGFRIARPLGR